MKVTKGLDHRICYVQLGFRIVLGFLGRVKPFVFSIHGPFFMSSSDCNSAYHRKINSYTKCMLGPFVGYPSFSGAYDQLQKPLVKSSEIIANHIARSYMKTWGPFRQANESIKQKASRQETHHSKQSFQLQSSFFTWHRIKQSHCLKTQPNRFLATGVV